MKIKINLGQALTILANLTVVARIAVLIVQIREDRAYAIVENTITVGHGLADWHGDVPHDEPRADILMWGSRDFTALTGSGPRGESLFMTGIYRRLPDLPGTQAWWAQADRRGIPNGAIAYIDDYLGLEYSGANR